MKKIIVYIIFGIIGLFFAVPVVRSTYSHINAHQSGIDTVAVFDHYVSEKNSDNKTTYREVFKYNHQGSEITYSPNFTSNVRAYSKGDSLNAKIYEDKLYIFNMKRLLVTKALPIVLLFVFFIFIIFQIRKTIKYNKNRKKLLKFGQKREILFISREYTGLSQNKNRQSIITFQEKNGSSKYIEKTFLGFSQHYLEENTFNVYIDNSDFSNYFIELTKPLIVLKD